MHLPQMTISLLAILLAALSGCGSATPSSAAVDTEAAQIASSAIQLKYSFQKSNQGWRTSGARGDLPTGDGSGIYLRGTNELMNLFLWTAKDLGTSDGIEPGREYLLYARVGFVSGASDDCMGMGGSPGGMEMYLGAGEKFLADGYKFIGTIDNGKVCDASLTDYVQLQKVSREPIRVRADEYGNLSVLIGVRGGFAGETRLWIESIELRVQPI